MKNKLTDLVVRSAGQAGDAARSAAASTGKAVADTVSGVASRSAEAIQKALPDRKTVQRGVGDALVFGGKLLYDPRATVGELAIGLGQGMRPSQIEDTWLLLRASETGFEVIGRGSEIDMRQAFEQARKTVPVLLCQARAASDPPPD
jgi:hypothetical protein